jgi:hypothetical protein
MRPIQFSFSQWSMNPGDIIEVIINNQNSYTFWINDDADTCIGARKLGRFNSNLFGEELEEEKQLAQEIVDERWNEEVDNYYRSI